MIIEEFAKFLQKHEEDLLIHKMTPLELLPMWISQKIKKNPKSNVDKIIHKEILYCENSQKDSVIIGKSDSGRVLVKSLIEFAKSYNNYTYAKWLDNTNKSFYSKNKS